VLCTFETVGNRVNKVDDANKPLDSYPRTAYFDSGADAHYFKDQPDDYRQESMGVVVTTGGEEHAIRGVGTIRFGQVNLDPIYHVPPSKGTLSPLPLS
jgi:hypothetical protein